MKGQGPTALRLGLSAAGDASVTSKVIHRDLVIVLKIALLHGSELAMWQCLKSSVADSGMLGSTYMMGAVQIPPEGTRALIHSLCLPAVIRCFHEALAL